MPIREQTSTASGWKLLLGAERAWSVQSGSVVRGLLWGFLAAALVASIELLSVWSLGRSSPYWFVPVAGGTAAILTVLGYTLSPRYAVFLIGCVAVVGFSRSLMLHVEETLKVESESAQLRGIIRQDASVLADFNARYPQLATGLRELESAYLTPDLVSSFEDSEGRVNSLEIGLFDISGTGVVSYVMSGLQSQSGHPTPFSVPVGSNLYVPTEISRFVDVRHVSESDEGVPIDYAVKPFETDFNTYSFGFSFDIPAESFEIRRTVCIPGSQLLNPDAFLLPLHLFPALARDVVVTLISDSQVDPVLVLVPEDYSRENGYRFADTVVQGVSVDEEDARRKVRDVVGTVPGSRISADTRLHATRFAIPVTSRPFFVVYFKIKSSHVTDLTG